MLFIFRTKRKQLPRHLKKTPKKLNSLRVFCFPKKKNLRAFPPLYASMKFVISHCRSLFCFCFSLFPVIANCLNTPITTLSAVEQLNACTMHRYQNNWLSPSAFLASFFCISQLVCGGGGGRSPIMSLQQVYESQVAPLFSFFFLSFLYIYNKSRLSYSSMLH